MAPASRARGHSKAHAIAHTATPATADPSRHRFMPGTLMFSLPSRWCAAFKTQPPTKEGLSLDDNIVSNLHEQMSARGLWESPTPATMVHRTSTLRHVSDCVRLHCYPR